MYKKIIWGGIFTFLLTGVLILSGCASNQIIKKTNGTEKIKVVATIYPLYDIVKIVGGEKIDPILILPPGSSPHTYEVSPTQIKEMQNTKLLFVIGAGVDIWAENIAKTVEGVEVIDLDQYVILKPFEHQEHEHEEERSEETREEEHHDHGSMDPHYWLSPDNAKIMAEQVVQKLVSFDPDNKLYYESQAQNFVSALDIKDVEWKNKINQLTKKELVVFHDAWGYFANHFGLEIVATFEPFPGKSPSPQYLIGLQKEVKKHNVTALFIEPQLSKEAVATLADDLKIKVDVLDPLGGIDERNSYINMIDYNINNIYEALK